jgi:peptidoglycan L-alanyl-D-glutamate endopeptidase CwlK
MKTKISYIFTTLIFILFVLGGKMEYKIQQPKLISDCHYTLSEALAGKDIPKDIIEDLRLVDVYYFSFDKKLHKGQLVIHKDLVNDVEWIFEMLKEKKFPIKSVIPVVRYNWSDDESMKANNTSAFNYRLVANTNRFSNHSTGRAIDINPWQNPQIIDGKPSPEGAVYNPKAKGTISKRSIVVRLFKSRGWNWGGDWKTRTDYQHFEKLK